MKAWLGLSLALVSCDLGGDAAHQGSYGFLPGGGAVETAARPLTEFLIVEADGAAERTLFYYFEGELGRVGIGVEDLARLARGFGGARMRFEFPSAAYGTEEVEGGAGAGGEGGGAGAGEKEIEEGAVGLEVDGEMVWLEPLATEELGWAGALRFVGGLEAPGYRVRGYFGIWQSAREFERVRVGAMEYAAELGARVPEFERTESEVRVRYDGLLAPDYVEVALLQPVVRIEDEAELDASVSTLLWPETPYVARTELVESAFEQGCWQASEPLTVRLTQVARHYQVGANGDSAVSYRRLDSLDLDPSEWADVVSDPRKAPYCDSFR